MNKPRVLVCDDSILMRRLVGDCLTSAGWEVAAEASDGQHAMFGGTLRGSSATVTVRVTGAAARPARSASSVARDSRVPVGLLGLHTNTTAGRSAAITSPASVGETRKSAVRSAVVTRVPVMRQMWAWRAYVGSNTTAVRPGPP